MRLILCALLASLPLVAAAEPPLVTDRPDQTESALAVPKGAWQIEAGWGDADGADDALTSLFRIGTHEKVELRLGIDTFPLGGADDSFDLSLGAKWAIAPEKGKRPAIALLGAVNRLNGDYPAGTNNEPRPSIRLILSNTLTERLSIGYNVGVRTVAINTTDDHLVSRAFWTASLGISATERVGFFVEAFGDGGLSDRAPTESSLNGGLTWLVRDRVQLDLFTGGGLADASSDWFVGTGVSVRLPD